jgi:proteasome lid subunit RPN8/RPN11
MRTTMDDITGAEQATMERPGTVPVDPVVITRAVREAMVAHAVAELPNEACGLIAGPEGRFEHLFPMTNADHSPLTYRLDPLEHLRTFDEIDARGWELAGIFHSHTHTEAYPSATDRRLAFYPEATYVLVSLKDRSHPEVRAFRIVDGDVSEREVVVR